MGDFNSWVTLSMKFDCRRVRLMALIERIRYSTTPTTNSRMNVEPMDSRAQYTPEAASCRAPNTDSSTQPTVNTASRTNMAMARRIGVLRERRKDIMVESGSRWNAYAAFFSGFFFGCSR